MDRLWGWTAMRKHTKEFAFHHAAPETGNGPGRRTVPWSEAVRFPSA